MPAAAGGREQLPAADLGAPVQRPFQPWNDVAVAPGTHAV
jgi:hypothetical protein